MSSYAGGRDPDAATEAANPAGTGGLTVGRTAALVGVSVRTLHHWDGIGLVRPSGRTWAGYRVYAGDDVARIHRVLIYKELGFSLAEIGPIIDDPNADARDHLRRQRSQLVERISRLQRMVDAVDRTLEAQGGGIRLTPEEQVEIFGADWQPERVDEAEELWGDTAQWAQYRERAAAMTAQDWKDVAATTEELNADLAAAHRAGTAPSSVAAGALAERHRALLSTYFDCTHAMHACIGRMFSDGTGADSTRAEGAGSDGAGGDADFAAYFDAMSPGLARWLRDAIFANARAHGVDPETATWPGCPS